MKSQNEKATAPTVASSENTLKTPDDFKAWFYTTQAERAKREAAIQRKAQEEALGFVQREVEKGLSIQEAGDLLLRYFGHTPPSAVYGVAAIAALSEIGWVKKAGLAE